MAILSELDVVNECLSTMGELPVSSLDDDHSLIAAARRALRFCNTREQARQWWFNTEVVTLVRDLNEYIFVPNDAIRCDPLNSSLNLIQRGRRLYETGSRDVEAGYKMKYSTLQCRLIREIPFEDLPPSAQTLICVAAQLRFMVAYDADGNRYRQLLGEYQEAYATVNAEHIRNNATNLLDKHPTIGRLRAIGGINSQRLNTPGAYFMED